MKICAYRLEHKDGHAGRMENRAGALARPGENREMGWWRTGGWWMYRGKMGSGRMGSWGQRVTMRRVWEDGGRVGGWWEELEDGGVGGWRAV